MPGLEEYLELLEKYWRKEAWERGLGEWGGGGGTVSVGMSGEEEKNRRGGGGGGGNDSVGRYAACASGTADKVHSGGCRVNGRSQTSASPDG